MQRFLLFILMVLLTGCVGLPAPTTEISIIFTGNFFVKADWRVPAGQEITIHFDNRDPVEHEFIVLFHAFTAPYSADDEASVYWRQSVPANSQQTARFPAPRAAANYPVYCRTASDPDVAVVGRLTVVNLP